VKLFTSSKPAAPAGLRTSESHGRAARVPGGFGV